MNKERIATVYTGYISAQGRLVEENETTAVVCIDEKLQKMVHGLKVMQTKLIPSFSV